MLVSVKQVVPRATADTIVGLGSQPRVRPTFNLRISEFKQFNPEFKANLVYILSSRQAKTNMFVSNRTKVSQ